MGLSPGTMMDRETTPVMCAPIHTQHAHTNKNIIKLTKRIQKMLKTQTKRSKI